MTKEEQKLRKRLDELCELLDYVGKELEISCYFKMNCKDKLNASYKNLADEADEIRSKLGLLPF